MHKPKLVLPLTAALALCFTLTSPAYSSPRFMRDGVTTVAVPYLPGGAVTAYVKRPARAWAELDFTCDGPQVIAVDLDDQVLSFITEHTAYLYSRRLQTDDLDAKPCGLTRAWDGTTIAAAAIVPLGLAAGETLVDAAVEVVDLATGQVGVVAIVDGKFGRELRLITGGGNTATTATSNESTAVEVVPTPVPGRFGVMVTGQDQAALGLLTVGPMGASIGWVDTPTPSWEFVPETLVFQGPQGQGQVGGFDASFFSYTGGPCSGDSGGPAFCATIQDGSEMVTLGFVADDPDNGDATWSVIETRSPIPGYVPGIIAVELDAGRKITMLSDDDGGTWTLDLWEGEVHRGSVYFGDNIKGGYIDDTDTQVALGASMFEHGDPRRPLVVGSMVMQSTDAAAADAPSIELPNQLTVSGSTAVGHLETGASELRDLELTAIGGTALAVIAAGDSGSKGIEVSADFWKDPPDIPGLAHIVGQVQDLLDVAPEDVAAFALQGEHAGLGERHVAAIAPAGDILRGGDSPVPGGWMAVVLGDPGSGKTTLAAVQGFSTASGDEAGNAPGGVVSSKFSGYGSGPDFDRSFAAITADTAAPIYDEVASVLDAQYGGWTELAAVETLSLSTDSEATATYVVQYTAHAAVSPYSGRLFTTVDYPVQDEAEAEEIAQSVFDDLSMDHVTGFIRWTDFNGHDPGIVELVVDATNLATGEVSNVVDVSCSMDSQWQSWSGTRLDALASSDPFQLTMTYTLTSPDGQLVTLNNAVGFGYAFDSDGDGLFDDEEYAVYGTDPLEADTDGDGVLDGDDPLPLEPGVDLEWLAAASDALAVAIDALDLALIDAPNNNAAANRRDNMASHADHAADRFDGGQISSAIAQLETILDRVDGSKKPKDWLLPSDEADAIAHQVLLLLELTDLL